MASDTPNDPLDRMLQVIPRQDHLKLVAGAAVIRMDILGS